MALLPLLALMALDASAASLAASSSRGVRVQDDSASAGTSASPEDGDRSGRPSTEATAPMILVVY